MTSEAEKDSDSFIPAKNAIAPNTIDEEIEATNSLFTSIHFV